MRESQDHSFYSAFFCFQYLAFNNHQHIVTGKIRKHLNLAITYQRLTLPHNIIMLLTSNSQNYSLSVYGYLTLLTMLLSGTTGCIAHKPYTTQPPQITRSADVADVSDNSAVSAKLLSQYLEWQDTPYREGGLSKRGVDCSGFVYITFRSKFGYDIPRTTDSQVELGSTVNKSSLRSGDLIFFKTGFFSRHVGIYLNDSKFIHASTSRGVIVSSLNEWYWRKNYWTAKRLDI